MSTTRNPLKPIYITTTGWRISNRKERGNFKPGVQSWTVGSCNNTSLFLLVVIDYSLAALGQNCDSYCEALGKTCVKDGAFPGGSAQDIFSDLGIGCERHESYWAKDQPAYHPNMQLCYGMTGIPCEIDCGAGGNNSVRRLCPCS